MPEKFNIHAAWNGSWKMVEGRYLYIDDPDVKTKSFVVVMGITLNDLKQKIASRMKSGIKPIRTMILHHLPLGGDKYMLKPSEVEDDDDLNDVFGLYHSEHSIAVPLYVTWGEDGDEGLGVESRGRDSSKLVPRRNDGVDTVQPLEIYGDIPVSLDGFDGWITEAGDTEANQTGAEDTEAGDTEANQTGADDTEAGDTEANQTGADDTEAGDTEACQTGADDTEAGDTEACQTGADDTEADDFDAGPSNTYEPFPNRSLAHWPAPQCDLSIDQLPPHVIPSNIRDDGAEIQLGEIFDTRQKFVDKIVEAAKNNGWQYRTKRRDTTRVSLKCNDKTCGWRIVIYKCKEAEHFQVRRYTKEHSCSTISFNLKHKNITDTVIAKRMIHRFHNPSKIPDVSEVLNYARENLKTECSPWKGYRVRKKASDMISGTRSENYADLEACFRLIAHNNIGTKWDIETDENHRFLYCYLALGAQTQGIKYMRPVIVLDCAWLKDEPGQLAVATMIDSEEQCFPIMWGVLDSENNRSWEWFLTKLTQFVADNHGLLFISDRNASIENGIKKVFPQSFHGICYFHLLGNLNTHYKKQGIAGLFYKAAFTYNPGDVDRYLDDMDKLYPPPKDSSNAMSPKQYLLKIGKDRWSRAYSPLVRFNTITSNHVESINSAFNAARRTKLVSLFTVIVDRMSTWFYERRRDGSKMGTVYTDLREKLMTKNYGKCLMMQAKHINNFLFSVDGDSELGLQRVDFEHQSCTCGEFQLQWQPCVHACACASELKRVCPDLETGEMRVMYQFTSKLYKVKKFRKAYAPEIFPIPSREQWNRNEMPASWFERTVLPPVKLTRSGRRKEKRFPGTLDKQWTKRNYKCGACGGPGHNRHNCKKNNTEGNAHTQ